jgi:hypothetical protein
VLDPSPFVDSNGTAYLIFKTNDGSSSEASQVESVPLNSAGTGFAGMPTPILTVDQPQLPWETTVDDPDMVLSGGTYYLLFSAGNFQNASYDEALATCAGPVGPCTQPSNPFLTSYGSVAGPGGGSLFTDASGNWYLTYSGRAGPCTTSCGTVRNLFVAPINLSNGLSVPCARPVGTPTGYRMTGGDGGVFNFGNLPFCGSTGEIHLNQPVVGMAGTVDGGGYWTVARDGGIFTFGDAEYYGSMGGTPLNQPIVGMASTPDGGGYWLVAADGGIFSFGDAQSHYYGSMGGSHLNRPIVAMASTANGDGYWLVASDGGIFTFGDAGFLGSMGGSHLNAPIVGMAPTPSGHGYWMVASDGGIFTFGDAPFDGSMGNVQLNEPVVAMSST